MLVTKEILEQLEQAYIPANLKENANGMGYQDKPGFATNVISVSVVQVFLKDTK